MMNAIARTLSFFFRDWCDEDDDDDDAVEVLVSSAPLIPLGEGASAMAGHGELEENAHNPRFPENALSSKEWLSFGTSPVRLL
mgnify:CR=1 FL=1